MIYRDKEIETEAVMNVAQQMCAAARTAPKAIGEDNLSILLVNGADVKRLTKKMEEIGGREERFSFYNLNAKSVSKCDAVVMIGTSIKSLGLNCGFCGFGGCEELDKSKSPCAYNTGDLGIAIGSAVALAARSHIDNRIMLSCGVAAIELGLFDRSIKIAYGIPLSVTGKNIFFGKPSPAA
jgi:uncharacterized ferredoxin-like protein